MSNVTLACSPVVVDNSYPAKVAKLAAYSSILAVSLIGNVLIIAVVYKHRHTGMWTTTNCFIANMAFSDLIIPLFAVPNRIFNLARDASFLWMWSGTGGLILCKTLNFLLDVSTAVSILSLVAIASDRYYAVKFPLKAVVSRPTRVCAIVIPVIWLSAAGFHAIYFYTFRLLEWNHNTYCILDWQPYTDSMRAQRPFYMCQFVLLYAAPLLLIAFLYACVIRKLREGALATHKPLRRRRSERSRNRKVTKMCVVAVLCFVLCWAPIHVYSLYFHFVWGWAAPCGMQELTFLVFFAAYSYAAINPFIFMIFNEKYRRGVKSLFTAKKILRRQLSDSSFRSRSSSGFASRLRYCGSNQSESSRVQSVRNVSWATGV